MRKLAPLLIALLVITTSVACNDDRDDQPTIAPTEENQPATLIPTTIAPSGEAPTLGPTAYPAFATATPPGVDAGYPIATPIPTADPYPGGLATILHPMGLQCEEATFPDLTAAIDSLEVVGISVVAAEEIGLEVCEACGCASSIHYRLQIKAEDLDQALQMGWQR